MRRLVLLLAVAVAPAQEAAGPAETRLDEANQEAATRIHRTFAKQGRDLRTQLKGLRKEDVIVVGGLFDFAQELLKAYRVDCTVITPAELETHPLDPPERKLIFLNCHLLDRNFPDTQPGAARPGEKEAARDLERVLKETGLDGPTAPGKAIRDRFSEVKFFAASDYSLAGLARLGKAVRDGAWVVSTDWAVLALERALPGTVRWTGHRTFEEKVDVQPALAGRRHPLLDGVFPESGKARWWIETESYLFAVRGRHTLLVESRQLGARYGGNRSVVVLIEPGKGRVLHALTHAYLQQGTPDDASVMQRLVLNFMLEKSLQNWKREGN